MTNIQIGFIICSFYAAVRAITGYKVGVVKMAIAGFAEMAGILGFGMFVYFCYVALFS